jgi:D-aminopeptidase
VKQGISRGAAISLSAPEARSRIRSGIRQAVERQRNQPLAPLQWPGPYVLEKRFFHTHVADQASVQPGALRVDSQTVRFHGENIRELIFR